MITVQINLPPTITFHAPNETPTTTNKTIGCLQSVGTIRSQVMFLDRVENSNVTVSLSNHNNRVITWFLPVPLRAELIIFEDATQIFSGLITELSYGEIISITAEGGQSAALSEDVPLRDSTVWENYRQQQLLGIGYGTVTTVPVPIDDTEKYFLLFDHPVLSVPQVTRDNAPAPFEWKNETDTIGSAISTIVLDAPLSQGEQLIATVQGKPHPTTGELISNPATIIWDLLHTSGIILAEDLFDNLKTECANAGIVLAGIVNQRRSIQSYVVEILRNCFALGSLDMPGFGKLWKPILASDPSEFVIYSRDQAGPIDILLQQFKAVLAARFSFDQARGTYRQSIKLSAADVVRRYGERGAEDIVDFTWIQDSVVAVSVLTRMLQYLSAFTFTETVSVARNARANLGTIARNEAEPYTVANDGMLITATEFEPTAGAYSVTVEYSTAYETEIDIDHLSTAFSPQAPAGASVDFASGELRSYILKEDGQPEVDARVTLDTQVGFTDRLGFIAFIVERRDSYTLYIEPVVGEAYTIVTQL